ncbi:adenosylmethionine--8-amino-7-oxononanoate transaminase, partial [Providencia rettgeri]
MSSVGGEPWGFSKTCFLLLIRCRLVNLYLFNFVYKSTMTTDDLAFDQRHIWHPYTSMTSPLPVYPVVSAEGCELILSDGRPLVDRMSSWWAAIHAYNHP